MFVCLFLFMCMLCLLNRFAHSAGPEVELEGMVACFLSNCWEVSLHTLGIRGSANTFVDSIYVLVSFRRSLSYIRATP